jgi:ABC-type amino acid transport substrate-binding protein
MDERRIERALRLGPPDEPVYRPGVDQHLGTSDEAAGSPTRSTAAADAPVLERPVRIDVHRRRRTQPRVTSLVAPLAAAIVVLVGAGLWLASSRVQPDTAASAPPGDALARLFGTGKVRVAVTDGPPQTTSSGGAYIGFDIDVARAVADKLGLRADVTAVPSTVLAASAPTSWDLALPGRAPVDGQARTVPYYAWPSWVAVPIDAPVSDIAGLAGARICAIEGSAGAAWLAGQRADGVSAEAPPPAVEVVEGTSDEDCAQAIGAGRADALVTDALLDDELGPRGLRAVTASPTLVETRSILIGEGAGSGDVTSLVAAVEGAIADLRAEGRLTDISRAAFGGRDLTEGVR